MGVEEWGGGEYVNNQNKTNMLTDVETLITEFKQFRAAKVSKVDSKNTLSLSAKTNPGPQEYGWAFVDPSKFNNQSRYGGITSGGSKIWLYKKEDKTEDSIKKERTYGILFMFDCVNVVHDLSLNDNTLRIEINKNAFFWWFNSNSKISVKNKFSKLNPEDIEYPISKSFPKNMDSNSPSHPPAGRFSSPKPFGI